MIESVMMSGKPLSEVAHFELLRAAIRMAKEGANKYQINNDDVRGVVVTDWQTGCQCGKLGYFFRATVETPKGKTGVVFLVPTNDLEEGMLPSGMMSRAHIIAPAPKGRQFKGPASFSNN